MNQPGPVEPVDVLGRGVVIAVALTAHRRLDACFGQPLGVEDIDVLRVSVEMTDQLSFMHWLSRA